MMTDPSPSQHAALVDHHGYRIRLSPSSLDWMALVTRTDQKPTPIPLQSH